MISREEVVWGYKILLGREPESESIIQASMSSLDMNAFRASLLSSTEFATKYPLNATSRLNGIEPPMDIDLDKATDFTLIFQKVIKAWKKLGEDEPYWSVITEERFKNIGVHDADAFYATGVDTRRQIEATCLRHGLNITDAKFEKMLELGCGVGRVTFAMRSKADEYYAYDISRKHISLAKGWMAANSIPEEDLTFEVLDMYCPTFPPVDFALSVITLQHNPPPVISQMIHSLLACLRKGGIAYFQVPTYYYGYSFDAKEYLSSEEHGMEMHAIPQWIVHDLADELGCKLIAVEEDNWTGLRQLGRSNTFIYMKR